MLWYTEVEGLGPAEAAPLLGMKPGAVKQLAFRAREGLREAWIQAHIAALGDGSECRWAVEHLGAHARGNLTPRNRSRIEAHLADCQECAVLAGEAEEVGSRLALALLPVFIGVTATASYLASLRGDGAVLALAAMPSGVVEGAVAAGGGITAAGTALTAGSATGGAATGGAVAASAAAAAGGAVKADVAVGGDGIGVGADVAGGTVTTDVTVDGDGIGVDAGVAGDLVGVGAEVGDGIDVGVSVGGIDLGVSLGGKGGLLGLKLG